MKNNHYLYLRILRHADHAVFCVQDGQKSYRHPVFNTNVPFSSGQQVKRSVLEAMLDMLGEPFSPVQITQVLKKTTSKTSLGDGEPLSAADPAFADQLIGGWMKAQKQDKTKGKKEEEGGEAKRVYRRRSPLSISAMRALHPLLTSMNQESVTFDRTGVPGDHQVIVRDEKGNSLMVEDENGKLVPGPELQAFLDDTGDSLKLRTFMPKGKISPRATGLFVVDIAIDLRRLFTVSTDPYDPEVDNATAARLRDLGWRAEGHTLACPPERREEIIEALSEALIHWRITSNQARTYSPQETLAVAISPNANRIAAAIRADLADAVDTERQQAVPVVEPIDGVELFISPALRAYIAGVDQADPLAAEKAARFIRDRLHQAVA